MTDQRAGLSAAKAGLVYFLMVFTVGFLLGTIRTLMIVPVIGEFGAVLVELPFMLLVSWVSCKWVIRVFVVPRCMLPRVTMGLTAFLLLLCAETLLSVFLLNLSLSQHFALYLHVTAQLGLLGQIAFALFPLVQTWAASNKSNESEH